MERVDFIRLVEKCEHRAAARPRWFRAKLRMWMSLGTLYLIAMLIVGLLGLLVCVSLLAAVIYSGGKGVGGLFFFLPAFGVPSVLLLYGTVRAALVRIRPSPGKELSPREFLVLHEDVREICKLLNAPPIHRIVLND